MSLSVAGLRAFDPGRDWAGAAALIGAAHGHDRVDWLPSVADLVHDWTNLPGFDPATDVVVTEDGGLLSGLATVDWRERDGRFISHMVNIWVRPERRRAGLGTALLEWAEARSRAAVAAGTAGRRDWPHVIGGWGDEDVAGPAELAARHGYLAYRHGFEMRRRVDVPIEEHPLPDGLEVRPVEPAHHRAIWDADIEAFLDHPEPATRTEADFQRWFSAPHLDTTLWQVAWAGDVVAGSVLTSINAEENERLGVSRAWLDHISVRRPWRRRGLAAALIASTIRLLRARGVAEAALGVDAENPTGALRLYEGLGFVRHRMGIVYRKTLDV